MPRLTDVFELLEALATNPCRSLRKIVDRQSRWRPRELQFEQMEAAYDDIRLLSIRLDHISI